MNQANGVDHPPSMSGLVFAPGCANGCSTSNTCRRLRPASESPCARTASRMRRASGEPILASLSFPPLKTVANSSASCGHVTGRRRDSPKTRAHSARGCALRRHRSLRIPETSIRPKRMCAIVTAARYIVEIWKNCCSLTAIRSRNRIVGAMSHKMALKSAAVGVRLTSRCRSLRNSAACGGRRSHTEAQS
eukprot:scaffold259850_cov36-Tisochrysis_lutea.AAC.2